MFNKISRVFRKMHRYLTPVFVIVTIMTVLVTDSPVFVKVQKLTMLTLVVTGSFLFIQIYYNKYFKKRKKK